MKVYRSSLVGTIMPPGSKSVTHRGYIITGLGGGAVNNALNAADTNSTKSCMEKMGAVFEGDKVIQTASSAGGTLNCGNSGTTLRLLTAVSSLFPGSTTLDGDASLRTRPMKSLVNTLRDAGVRVKGVHAPITVEGPLPKAPLNLEIDAAVSSQYISALLMMCAFHPYESIITLRKELVSKPYVDLTVQMLVEAGVNISTSGKTYVIEGGTIRASNYNVPADMSSAAFFIAAGAIPGNDLEIKGISELYPQADSAIIGFVERMGAKIERFTGGLRVHGNTLHANDMDVRNSPDIFPILSVLASLANGKTVISGAQHLRYKETDRISTTVRMLDAMGITVEEKEDGAVIHGEGVIRGGCIVDSFHDHRIAMAATIAASAANNPVEILNPYCTEISYPMFYRDFKSVGGDLKDVTSKS